MKLYELAEEMKNFDYVIDEETGEVLNADELDQLEMDFNTKLQNCIWYYKNCLAEADALKAEKAKFANRQKIAEAKANRIKEYISLCTDGNKWESADHLNKVSYRKSEEVHADIDKLDDEFLRFKAPEVDKARLKKALKAGEVIEGAWLVEKQNIQLV